MLNEQRTVSFGTWRLFTGSLTDTKNNCLPIFLFQSSSPNRYDIWIPDGPDFLTDRHFIPVVLIEEFGAREPFWVSEGIVKPARMLVSDPEDGYRWVFRSKSPWALGRTLADGSQPIRLMGSQSELETELWERFCMEAMEILSQPVV